MGCLEILSNVAAFLARFVLFFASLSFLAKTLFWCHLALKLRISRVISNASIFNLDPATLMKANLFATSLLIVSVVLVMLAIYVMYVSIMSHQCGIRRTIYMSSFFGLVCMAILFFAAPSLVEIQDKTLDILHETQAQYDWDSYHALNHAKHAPPSPPKPLTPKEQATIVWDILQENLHCCGFNKPEDWYEVMPAAKKNELPISCCRDVMEASTRGDGYCLKDMPHWSEGCKQGVKKVVQRVIEMISSTSSFCLFFSILACLILICQLHGNTNAPSTSSRSYIYGVYQPNSHDTQPIYPPLPKYQPDSFHSKYGSY